MVPSIWCILYTNKVIKGDAKLLTRISWCCLTPILSVSFKGMGCEPVLDLSATPDEAVSIMCTFVDKTRLLTFWGKLMYVSHTTDWPGVSVGHPVDALAIICLWVLWSYAYGMLGQDDIAPGEFCSSNVYANTSFRIRQFFSCMFMIISDPYIVKWHGSHAWYGCWTIKALLEAKVLWWLYCDLRGHRSSVDHCQIFAVSLYL